MADLILGPYFKWFCTFSLSTYLLGVVSSKTIISANTLAKTFAGAQLLDQYDFWMILFFFSGAVFSFKDVSSTKVLQIVIAVVRVLCLAMFILGPIYIIFRNELDVFWPNFTGIYD